MTISVEEAMVIADAEAHRLGWGGITTERYDAVLLSVDDRQAWHVDHREEGWIGHHLRFLIDAETGEVIKRRRMGTR